VIPDILKKTKGGASGSSLHNDEALVREAEILLLRGEFSAATQTIEHAGSGDSYAVRALLAILDGRRKDALVLFEEGLKRLRKELGVRKVYFRCFSAFFLPPLLISFGDLKKAATCAELGRQLSSFDKTYELMLCLADYHSGKGSDKFFSLFSPARCVKEKNKQGLLVLLALYLSWSSPEALIDPEYRSLFLNALDELRESGDTFLLYRVELAEMLSLPPEKQIPGRKLPLRDLIPRKEEWMVALGALTTLGKGTGGAKKKRERRILWEVDWDTEENGTIVSPEFIPVEQVMQPSGKWSKGRQVALKRLQRELVKEPWMTRQDIAAAGAVEEIGGYDGWYYKRWFQFDGVKMFSALAGHPYLVQSGDGRPMEIVQEEPRLDLARTVGGYRVRLSPHPAEGKYANVFLEEESPCRIRVVPFDEKHRRIAEILGKEGLFVPERGKEHILETLESLAETVPITSEIEGVEGSAVAVEPDSRIVVQLAPGEEGFFVSLAVRPLGTGTHLCRPGEGGKTMMGRSDGQRIQTLRDLDAERRNRDEALVLCPALNEGEQTDENRWELDNPELCLEFLLQVAGMGERVVVEWPKGGAMSVRSAVSPSTVKLSVAAGRDWFALSGEIRVDEQTVLGIKEACEMLAESKGRFLPLGNGEFLALTAELRKRLEEIGSFGDWRGKELRFSPLSAPLFQKLEKETEGFGGDGEWAKQLALVEEAESIAPALPSTFKGVLRDYQAEGFQWLSRLAHWGAGACLADDMGLGKTIQVLAVLLSRAQTGPSLVIAPVSVCPNWFQEAARFAPTLNLKEFRYGDRRKILDDLEPFDVVVTSYGLLQQDGEMLHEVEWNTVVLDEAQAIKNAATKRSAAAMRLKGKFRIITTGTPIENHLGELWNLFRFLNPGLLGSLDSFNRRFATPIVKYDDKGARARLKKILRPFLLRRTKDQVLDELPPKTEITLRVDMHPEERSLYEALRRNALERIDKGDGEDQRFVILAELMKLRRACCNGSLVLPDREFPSSKLEAFGEILDDLRANGHRCLVFSQFVDHLAILRASLNEAGVSYAYLDGSTPPEERKRQVEVFQAGEKECFLISLRAGGTGLNLTAADYVIHMDPWWNPAVEDQASDRAHRIGQERPVTVYRIVAKDTIEEKIVDLHATKRDLAESLLEGTGRASRFSLDEMAALIRWD